MFYGVFYVVVWWCGGVLVVLWCDLLRAKKRGLKPLINNN